DSSRLEPGLYVVNATAGAWAASLADGNILLSRQAIDACMRYGTQRGEHLLAFVLAHELAHQRANDLWHQRFFRMVGTQSQKDQTSMLRGMNLDADQLQQMEQKEAQADHDGLILMSSVGYDPYQVLDKKDFFTVWVENIWQSSCQQTGDAALGQACQQAQSRALRTQIQLDNVASQAMLYELGVQAVVARQYRQARHYFTVFGRDYPSRAVISALAMTYLAEAVEIQQLLLKQGNLDQPGFYYPLILDASVQTVRKTASTRRGDQGARQKKQIQQLVNQGIKQLERAIELEPDYQTSYLMLGSAYLLANNTYMARGVLQGRYIPRFGADASSDLLLAMTHAIEGQPKAARGEFQALLKKLQKTNEVSGLPENLLLYSAFYNAAANDLFMGDEAAARASWQQLARMAQTAGNSLLFRLALGQLNPAAPVTTTALTVAPVVQGLRLGDAYKVNKLQDQSSDLWIEGDKFSVMRNHQGSHYVVSDKGKVINAWQEAEGSIENLLAIGDKPDRPLKALGMPDRHVHMLSGEYLAYDRYGLALHINQNKVQGWFLY
ncbi:MAG: hypothetical protein HYZ31_06245, partial [Gammaproteobacteria bacterium]|nr:hypothetical protein [Gammaproteobacteria bacterium]